MKFGVFIHRTDSIYNDVPSEKYHFPKKYLSRVRQLEGCWIIYLEPTKVRNTKGYFAVAQVQQVIPDPDQTDMYFAIMKSNSYLDFGTKVPFRIDEEILEKGVLNEKGNISGRAQAAVRILSVEDFNRIIRIGLGDEEDILPRRDVANAHSFVYEDQAEFTYPDERLRVDQIVNRSIRDRNFRKVVLRAYDNRCAITGLRLINGGGRAEVEAAHIRPVANDGPDIISNGLALSGTAHWMFDRGLIGLNSKHKIIISRQANDKDAVKNLINTTGHLILPKAITDHPRKEFVSWHYENCFKH